MPLCILDDWEYRTLLLEDAVKWVAGDIPKRGVSKTGPEYYPPQRGHTLGCLDQFHGGYADIRFTLHLPEPERGAKDVDAALQDRYWEQGPTRRWQYDLPIGVCRGIDAVIEKDLRDLAKYDNGGGPNRPGRGRQKIRRYTE